MGRALQRDLNRIAETADTSTSEGLGYVLTGEHTETHTATEVLGLGFIPYTKYPPTVLYLLFCFF